MVGIGGNTEGEGRGIPLWKDWNKMAADLKKSLIRKIVY